MRRGRGRPVGIAVAVAVAVSAFAVVVTGPAPIGAQEAPTITVDPAGDVAPGEPLTFTIDGCTGASHAVVSTQFDDAALVVELAGPGPWTFTVGAHDADLSVAVGCDEGRAEVLVDVENPILSRGGLVPEDSNLVFGTDCPETGDVAPRVTVDGEALRGPFVLAVDPEGDWAVDLTDLVVDGVHEVGATCGAVVYAPITVTVTGSNPGPFEEPTTTSTSPAATGGAAAPPATPLVAAARFTG